MKKALISRYVAVGMGLVLCFGTAACGRRIEADPVPEAEGGISATAYIVKADGTRVYPDEEYRNTSIFHNDEEEDSEEDPENISDSGNETEKEQDRTENAGEDIDLLGHHNAKIYENTYFGVGCRLNDGWEYLDDEQIEQLARDTAEWMDTEEIYRLLDSGSILHAMSANPKEGGASMSIDVERLDDKYNDYTLEEYYQEVQEPLKMSLEAGGIEVTEIKIVTMNVFGIDREAFHLTLSAGGMTIDEFVVYIIRDGYIATCTAGSTYGYDETAELLDCYYAVH